MMKQLNVFNESIHECCLNPITGYHRDGFCNYHTSDSGLHLVCALMTETFLSFSRSGEMISQHQDLNLIFQD